MELNLKRIISTIALTSSLLSFCAEYSVKGYVTDSVGNPEAFATVRIFNLNDTIKPIKGLTTDDSGKFSTPLPSAGSYRVNIAAFGKRPSNNDVTLTTQQSIADLGQIIVKETDNLLEELVVTAQKPLVTKEIDRIGYDVQADPDAKTSQLDEMLKRVPLVSVDPDGTIKVKGSSDFKIYKNGRPNNSFTRNAKDIFKSIPASIIKKIEVITDPGAREDAEGTSAILNIVTIENTVVKSVMGSVGLSYRTPGYPAPNLWLTSQINKVAFSIYAGGHVLAGKENRGRSESLTHYEDSGNEMKSSDNSDGNGYISFFGTELSYELDSLNLFTAEFGGYIYDIRNRSHGQTVMTDAEGRLIYSYNSVTHTSPNRYFDLNGGFNYQHSTRRKGENLIFSYRLSTTDQRQHSTTEYEEQENLPVPYTGIDNDFSLNFIEHTGQIDWTRPINKFNTFDVGTKYINRRNHSLNDIDYIGNRREHSDFSHITQVVALYADYRLNYRKFGARAGLRYEYSRLSAKYKDGSNDPFHSNLSDWVPNASISYNINDGNTVKLSYSSRINRPGISQLNPAIVESPSSISSGNPDLGSSRHQSFTLNYNHFGRKINVDINLGHSFSNNSVINVQNLINGDIVQSTYANAGRNRDFFFNVWGQWRATPKTSVMLNANVVWNKFKTGTISSEGWTVNTFFRVRQNLPWDINLSLSVNLWKPGTSLYSRQTTSFDENIYYDIDLQKSFLKDRRLGVNIGITNPFRRSTRINTSEPLNTGYTGYTRNWKYNHANLFNISISYRFGSMNIQVKKTARSISNDDVESNKN